MRGFWCSSEGFPLIVSSALRTAFAYMRGEVGGQGRRDVLGLLGDEAECLHLLRLLCPEVPVAEGDRLEVSGPATVALQRVADRRAGTEEVAAPLRMALKVVTWNIAGSSVSCQAPSGFVIRDKLAFVVAEVLRWGADLVTLQECVSSNPLAGLDVKYVLVGAEWVDVQRSYVHLYARKGLGAEMVPKRGRWPGVLARLVVDGEALDVAAVHLEPGPQGAEERKRQLSAISLEVKGSAAVVLGDFNIRLEEEDALLECVAGRISRSVFHRILLRAWM